MSSLLWRLRRKLLGETWTIPLGIAAALVLALVFRALLSSGEWQTMGGFGLAAVLITTLIRSLPLERRRTTLIRSLPLERRRTPDETAAAHVQQHDPPQGVTRCTSGNGG